MALSVSDAQEPAVVDTLLEVIAPASTSLNTTDRTRRRRTHRAVRVR
jgi:hypothetical protein